MEATKHPLSLDETLSQIDDCLTQFHTHFSAFTTKYPNFEILANSSAHPKEQNARTNLGLAYALNSLYYSTLRLAQTDYPTEVKQHPVHAQIKIVRDHYVKLDQAVKRRKVTSDDGVAVVHRIVERTVRENARIIKGQEKEAEIAKKKAQTSSSESESSDSEESSESSEVEEKSEEKPVVEQVGKKKSQVAMHGATVVPVPAYLRNKQLLERLKK